MGAAVSPTELQTLIYAARRGEPFMFLRDDDGSQRVVTLTGDRLVLGRAPGSDLEIAWDPRVSGVHAYLERRGPRWVIEDDGLSRNGTFVNGERLRGQRTLRDGDVLRLGDTAIGFRDPETEPVVATVSVTTLAVPDVSEAQRRVLVALCRPLTADEPSGAGDERADRRRTGAQPVRGQRTPARAVRSLRPRRRAAEPEAPPARGASASGQRRAPRGSSVGPRPRPTRSGPSRRPSSCRGACVRNHRPRSSRTRSRSIRSLGWPAAWRWVAATSAARRRWWSAAPGWLSSSKGSCW